MRPFRRPSPRSTPSSVPAPRFSVVAAAYNVAPYLQTWFDSLQGQGRADDLEVVVVDDGSTDDTHAMLASFRREFPGRFVLLQQENAGQAAARNLGMAHATGEWLTFIDPDDFVATDYFARVDRFLRRNPGTPMLATHLALYLEAQRTHVPHALDHLFRARDQVRDLNEDPRFFHASASAAFFRRETVTADGLRFSSRLGPHFEDAHFCISYLLNLPRPRLAFLGSARYSYRIRAARTSTSQQSMADPRRFTDTPRYGYLDILRMAESVLGHVPDWLQNQIVYELRWYFKAEADPGVTTAATDPEIADSFLALLQQILGYLRPQVIAQFDAQPLEPLWRDIMLHSFAGSWTGTELERQSQRTWLYRYVGRAPEELLPDGVLGKRRDVCMFGRTLMHERLLWADSAPEVRLDGRLLGRADATDTGRKVAVSGGVEAPPSGTYPRSLPNHGRDRLRRAAVNLRGRLVHGQANLRHPGRPPVWVLDDGPGGLTRSCEVFFEYLRDARPTLEVWFAAEPDSPAWRRLVERHADRLVGRGGTDWRDLLLRAQVLVSSDPSARAQHPPALTKLADPRWLAVYLPASSFGSDMSRWLNPGRLDLVLAANDEDAAVMSGDGGNYRYGSPQVRSTGLPRFDRWASAPATASPLVLVDLSLPDGTLATSSTAVAWGPSMSADDRLTYHEEWSQALPSLLEEVHSAGREALVLSDDPLADVPSALPDAVDVDALLARAEVFITTASPLTGDARVRGSRVLLARTSRQPLTGLGCQRRDEVSVPLSGAQDALQRLLSDGRGLPAVDARDRAAAVLREIETVLAAGPGGPRER